MRVPRNPQRPTSWKQGVANCRSMPMLCYMYVNVYLLCCRCISLKVIKQLMVYVYVEMRGHCVIAQSIWVVTRSFQNRTWYVDHSGCWDWILCIAQSRTVLKIERLSKDHTMGPLNIWWKCGCLFPEKLKARWALRAGMFGNIDQYCGWIIIAWL